MPEYFKICECKHEIKLNSPIQISLIEKRRNSSKAIYLFILQKRKQNIGKLHMSLLKGM